MALILNFTDSYKKDANLLKQENTIIDFTNLCGTGGYCTDESANVIREALKKYPYEGVHYLDDGNHHYLSKFFIERINEPFNLIVFDHHTDMQPSTLLPLLSCGNWILESIDSIENLKNVCLYGPTALSVKDLSLKDGRLHVLNEHEANEKPSYLPPECLPVYISVDADILDISEFKSVWDQGSMTRAQLEKWISYICKNRRVIGIDYCG